MPRTPRGERRGRGIPGLALASLALALPLQGLVAGPAQAFFCWPGGAPLVNHAPAGTVTASSSSAPPENAIDDDLGTFWASGYAQPTSVFTWEGAADLSIGRVHVTGGPSGFPNFVEVLIELLDASDTVLESETLFPSEDSPTQVWFDAHDTTARKVRLTLTADSPGLEVVVIAELRVETLGTPPPPPPAAGPGPEETNWGASFQGLGDAPGGGFLSKAHGVSPDGRVVVGETETAPGKVEAFRFADGALEPLGVGGEIESLYEGGFLPLVCVASDQSRAFAAANAGSTAVGEICTGTETCAPARFDGGPPVSLQPELSELFWDRGQATDVTPDGIQVLGSFSALQPESGFDPFGVVFRRVGGSDESLWSAIWSFVGWPVRASPEGGCVVTTLMSWDEVGGHGFGSCGAVPADGAADVSAGGVHVVGQIGGQAARGIEVLGDLPGGASVSLAQGVSDDGGTVVGWGTTEAGQEAFVWRRPWGMRLLADELADHGLDLGGWTLVQATGVSASGRTIVGWGTNPSGDTEGFVATLPAAGIPTPALSGPGLALLGLALVASALLAARGRRGAAGSGARASPRPHFSPRLVAGALRKQS